MVSRNARGTILLGLILLLVGCVACGDTDIFKDILTEEGVQQAPMIKIQKEVK